MEMGVPKRVIGRPPGKRVWLPITRVDPSATAVMPFSPIVNTAVAVGVA